eukprot:Hpha_TRINITY_DN14165_c0_g1::TRINITY_DN14165_c0_g1_i7::g.11189::m.11189
MYKQMSAAGAVMVPLHQAGGPQPSFEEPKAQAVAEQAEKTPPQAQAMTQVPMAQVPPGAGITIQGLPPGAPIPPAFLEMLKAQGIDPANVKMEGAPTMKSRDISFDQADQDTTDKRVQDAEAELAQLTEQIKQAQAKLKEVQAAKQVPAEKKQPRGCC